MTYLRRHAIAFTALLVALTAAPAAAFPTYLHKAKAHKAAQSAVEWMFEDSVTTPGSKIDGYSVVPVSDCRHRGRLVVTCGYTLTYGDVACDGTMRVRFTRYGLDAAPVGSPRCY